MRHTVGGAQKVLTPARRIWCKQGGRIEARIVIDEDRRFGDPRLEVTTPRVLGPAWRTDGQVNVAGPQPDPRHRGHVPDRVADL